VAIVSGYQPRATQLVATRAKPDATGVARRKKLAFARFTPDCPLEHEESLPRLPQFLELVDASTGRVQDWVAELVEIEQVPALAMRYRAAHAAKQLAFDAPWTEAILRALETPSYAALAQHEASWISQLLGLSEPEIRRCLDLLDQAGLVRWNGTRYAELKPLTVDTRGGKGALHALKAHWARVAAQRAAEPRKGDL
jgi:hypothetical protein